MAVSNRHSDVGFSFLHIDWGGGTVVELLVLSFLQASCICSSSHHHNDLSCNEQPAHFLKASHLFSFDLLKACQHPTPSTPQGSRMLFAMDFKLLLPDMLQLLVVAMMGVIQIRGIQALYHDFTRHRATPAPQREQHPEPPVPPPVAPPVAKTEPEPPAVIRQYIRTKTYPEKLWTSKVGSSYHLFENCQHIRTRAKVTSHELCSVCQQRASD